MAIRGFLSRLGLTQAGADAAVVLEELINRLPSMPIIMVDPCLLEPSSRMCGGGLPNTARLENVPTGKRGESPIHNVWDIFGRMFEVQLAEAAE